MKTLMMNLTVLTILVDAQMAKAERAKNDLLATATVRVLPGTEGAFRAAGLEILAPTRQEPGNEGYDAES